MSLPPLFWVPTRLRDTVAVTAPYAGSNYTDAVGGTPLDDVVQVVRTRRDGLAVLAVAVRGASPCAFEPRELFAAALRSSKVLSVAFDPALTSFAAFASFSVTKLT
jgi:hypothetical protein